MHVKKDRRSGFSSHMEKAIFVGYPAQFKGWEFYNPFTKHLVLSDRADFDERVFPGLATRLPEPPAFPSPPVSILPSPLVSDAGDEDDSHSEHRETHHQVGDGTQVPDASSSNSNASLPHSPSPPAVQAPPIQPSPPPEHAGTPFLINPDAPVRRSSRARVPTSEWKQNWFKANYKPQEHHIQPQPAPELQYRDPLPPVAPSSDENSQSSHSQSDSGESELVASKSAYLTLPEALEFAFKAGAHSDAPKSYAHAMALPNARSTMRQHVMRSSHFQTMEHGKSQNYHLEGKLLDVDGYCGKVKGRWLY